MRPRRRPGTQRNGYNPYPYNEPDPYFAHSGAYQPDPYPTHNGTYQPDPYPTHDETYPPFEQELHNHRFQPGDPPARNSGRYRIYAHDSTVNGKRNFEGSFEERWDDLGNYSGRWWSEEDGVEGTYYGDCEGFVAEGVRATEGGRQNFRYSGPGLFWDAMERY